MVFSNVAGTIARTLKALRETPFDDKRSMDADVTTFMITTEFGRTMRQMGASVDQTGTDHNQLSNSIILGGKGIRPQMVINQSDFRTADETLSKAHLSLDNFSVKAMGRPFDFSTMKPRSDLPDGFVETDYLGVGSVINTIYGMFSVPQSRWWTVGRDKVMAPTLDGLLV